MRLLPAILILLAACTAPPPSASEADILAFLQEFAADTGTANADSISGNYAEDVRILEDGRLAYQSRAEVREALAAYPAQGAVSLEFEDTRITPVGPDAAYVQTLFSQRFGGSEVSFSGAVSMLVVRSGDRWLISRSHTSTGANRSWQD